MKRKENKMEYREPWDKDYYQTGRTEPPRQNGIVAVLLVLVVFLTGLTSILSLLNIRLFSELYDQRLSEAPPALADLHEEANTLPELTGEAARGVPGLGITVDAVTGVYQRHFMLPEGLFITHVSYGSDAHRQGLQEGDVLLYLGQTRCNRVEHLQNLLKATNVGDQIDAVVYRSSTDENLRLKLTVEEIFQYDE